MSYNGIITELQLGRVKVNRVPEITIRHNRYSPVSICQITIADPDGSVYRAVSVGDVVSLKYGYKDGSQSIWKGSVTYLYRSYDNLYLTCSDAGRAALTERVTEYWLDETPAGIVRAVLSRIGSVQQITEPAVMYPSFSASDLSIYDIVQKVEHTLTEAHGIDTSQYALFLDSAGSWNWGEYQLEGDVPVISTQSGLIAHMPENKGYSSKKTVETWLLAEFTHSRDFRLKDAAAGIDSVFMADAVVHVLKQQKARTYIQYGGGYGKY